MKACVIIVVLTYMFCFLCLKAVTIGKIYNNSGTVFLKVRFLYR